MTRYLLDTNACVNYLRGAGSPHLRRRLEGAPAGAVVLCSVVLGELLYGVLRSERVDENLARGREFTNGLHSLPFDDAAAEQYARLRTALAAQGTLIGGNDLLIAAIALANGVTPVTHNTAEFSRVDGLVLEDWQAHA